MFGINCNWSILAMWLEYRFLDTEVDGSKPGISMYVSFEQDTLSALPQSTPAVKWVPGGDNLTKVVQRYERFRGIPL